MILLEVRGVAAPASFNTRIDRGATQVGRSYSFSGFRTDGIAMGSHQRLSDVMKHYSSKLKSEIYEPAKKDLKDIEENLISRLEEASMEGVNRQKFKELVAQVQKVAELHSLLEQRYRSIQSGAKRRLKELG